MLGLWLNNVTYFLSLLISNHFVKTNNPVVFMLKFCSAIVFFIASSSHVFAQKDSVIFNPKQEIAIDGKRYRVYNSWLSLGAGAGYNSKWPKDEKNIGVDYSFHIQQYYFRLGAFMSGVDFTANNNYNLHAGVGLRKEKEKYNLSIFAGPSSAYFRRPLSDSSSYNLGNVYNEIGGYACIEAVYKIKYDVGIGGQIFCDYNNVQMVYGVRLIAYFSGAYRGVKYGYHAPPKKK